MQVWQSWQVVAPVRPQLFLSSQADALIPPAEINLFMKQQVPAPSPLHSEIVIRAHLQSDALLHCQHHASQASCDPILQASRGVQVSSRQFADSAHCEHFRRYPAEYCNELESFLSNLT